MHDLHDLDLWINFALYAIYGKMREADTVMRECGDGVRRAADEMRRRMPIEDKQLFRGMLLDPARPLRTDERYTFVSWSEDVDVARWFGSRESYVSEPLASSNAQLRGYILTLDKAPTRVLFHYSWTRVFRMPLERLALVHPLMGAEGYRQIGWSLRTQCEVITEPLTELPAPRPVEAFTGPSVADLDKRYTPPWCTAWGFAS